MQTRRTRPPFITQTEFYVYVWLRDDSTPYYVGKGKGRRGFIRGQHSVRRPKTLDRIIILYCSSEKEALSIEAETIARFGRKDLGTGCLRNMTDGGDGGMSNPSQELRNRLSEKAKGHKRLLGHKHTAEARANMSSSAKGKPKAWCKGKPLSEAHRAACSAGQKKRSQDPEYITMKRAAANARWAKEKYGTNANTNDNVRM